MDTSLLLDLGMYILAAVILWTTRKVPAIDKLLHESCREPCDDCTICPKRK